MNANALNIKYRRIDDLTPHPSQLRQHSRAQRRKAKSLVQHHDQVMPIIVDTANVIIDGHLIWETLRDLGYDQIAVVVAANRSPEEIRALRLALNRLPEDSKWDKTALAIEIRELVELNFDMEFTAFDGPEIEACLTIDLPENAVEDNPLEGLRDDTQTISATGNLWILGQHRLFCGSALERSSFQVLMGDEFARMVFVDPPYNVPVNGHICGSGSIKHPEFAMASGEMSEERFTEFLGSSFKQLASFSVDGSIHFACMDWRHMSELLAAGGTAYTEVKNVCIWAKDNGGMGSLYRSQHELVFVFKNGTGRHINNVELGKHGRTRTNLWSYPGVNSLRKGRLEELAMHPTVKPIAMVADAILDVSNHGDIVLDSFGGSGTTLMAAEQTNRCARLIEISPRYVDVTIRRWENATGQKAVLESTGQTFAEIEAERLAATTKETEADHD